MAGASAAAEPNWSGGARNDALMSIGEVLAHLRVDFPDTTISKLRFLEAEGLVEPERTPAGYRKYSWGDITRLRYILAAQRDQYLPLRVIRDQLAAMDAGDGPTPIGLAAGLPEPQLRPTLTVAGGAARGTQTGVGGAAAVAGGTSDPRLSRDELIGRAGCDGELLADLERCALVSAHPGGWYDLDALEVATAAARLAEFGVHPRHLRSYRAAADREIGLFGQLVAPLARQNGPAARARAAEAVRELSLLTRRIHAALVRAGLRETLGR